MSLFEAKSAGITHTFLGVSRSGPRMSRASQAIVEIKGQPRLLSWAPRCSALWLAFWLVSLGWGSPSLRAAPPNVIVILADDLGAKELGCYGHPHHRTPNLDQMAADGARMETFYAMPLCTPTRVALMTGQYGFHNGFLGMSNPAFRPPKNTPQAAIFNHFTIGDLMKSAGYATAQVGKWQLAGELPTLIHDCGFDEYRM
ncbi:MAG: sulfatase-like hydrolase/transferase, partial [Pirellulaceae bacterium]